MASSGHTIGSLETQSVEGDPMVWPHPQKVILYARSSYFYNNMFNVYYVLKDNNMDSESLSLLIRLSVSDGQKTDSSKVVSFICI